MRNKIAILKNNVAIVIKMQLQEIFTVARKKIVELKSKFWGRKKYKKNLDLQGKHLPIVRYKDILQDIKLQYTKKNKKNKCNYQK